MVHSVRFTSKWGSWGHLTQNPLDLKKFWISSVSVAYSKTEEQEKYISVVKLKMWHNRLIMVPSGYLLIHNIVQFNSIIIEMISGHCPCRAGLDRTIYGYFYRDTTFPYKSTKSFSGSVKKYFILLAAILLICWTQ